MSTPGGGPSRVERAALIAIAAASLAALVAGWWVFWFLCDDAFIAFRYVQNSVRGHGYVWNPPPFRPVEGYTSFLWVVLLDAVWRVTGIEPPEASNPLSLGFSALALAIVGSLAWRMPLSAELGRHRVAWIGLAMVSTLSNRAFLAFTSSGLETALFTCLLLWWVGAATGGEAPRARAWAATAAAACSLARPDGLLFVAATAALIGRDAARTREPRVLLAAIPLGITASHLLWRYQVYGYWLPNTWYAKHVGAWPLSGAIYLASFLLEYALWVWLGVAALAAWRWARTRDLGWLGTDAAMVVATLVGHFGYYTVLVGGDHFEYRVYHHLIPLAAIAFPWLCDRLGWPSRRAMAVFVAMTAAGLFLPWTHWSLTHHTTGHKERGSFRFRVAPHLPLPLSWVAMPWDAAQWWLLGHFVGIRHQGHKTYLFYQQSRFPTREEGLRITADPDDLPVMKHSSVGWPAWVMPEVHMIDTLGLSDLVIARSPAVHTGQTDRKMAHDRKPPDGYVACFRPNVKAEDAGKVRVVPRKNKLAAAEVVQCETHWLDVVAR